MRRTIKGFTLIEVIAFFTVSMALIAGIFIGTGTAINRERYNDSVESFKSFLQEQYTLTANPQSAKYGKRGACVPYPSVSNVEYMYIDENAEQDYRGRSDCLMYGRLIEFYGTATNTPTGWASNGTVRVTPVVGKDLTSFCFNTENPSNPSDLGKCSGVSNEDLNYKLQLDQMSDNELLREAKLGRDGEGEVYNLEWDAYTDTFFLNPDGSSPDNMSQIPAQGAILIVRAPFSSTIRTFIIPCNDATDSATCGGNDKVYQGNASNLAYKGTTTNNLVDAFIPLKDPSNPKSADNQESMSSYQQTPRFFCVIPADTNFMSNARRVVKVTQNGGSSSAVDILSESDAIVCPEYTK
ncbi:MAG: hypothetical protein LBQ02_03780 [Candidatus Nomurabacteria bacterium]|jgi:hypothetical protein|nr:hypothetical protein [Candidatus Nomurabacteria bacterium]